MRKGLDHACLATLLGGILPSLGTALTCFIIYQPIILDSVTHLWHLVWIWQAVVVHIAFIVGTSRVRGVIGFMTSLILIEAMQACLCFVFFMTTVAVKFAFLLWFITINFTAVVLVEHPFFREQFLILLEKACRS